MADNIDIAVDAPPAELEQPATETTSSALSILPAGSAPGTGFMDIFNPSALPFTIAIIICTIVIVRLLTRLLQGLSEKFLKYRLLLKQANTFVAFAAYALAAGIALNRLFVLTPEALFALSGTLAVAAGFALKDFATSVIAGLSILINKPFQVGDRITFGGYYGEVKEIGMRTVRLVTLDDNLVSIPTDKFLTDPVASANAGALDCMVVTTYYISPQADHIRAKEIVREAVLASKYLYLGKPITVLISNRLSDRGDVIVEITAKAYVFDARHEKAFSSDVTSRVLTAFREDKIQMPTSPVAAIQAEQGSIS